MISVLHICETAKGGPATYLNLIADAVGRANNAIVVPQSHADCLDSDLRQHRFAHKRRSLGALVALARTSIKALRAEKPDLLFFHSTLSLFALLVLKLIGDKTPALYCGHGWAAHRYEEGSFKRRLVMFVEGWLCALPDCVVCVSQYDHQFAHMHGYRGQFQMVENAVPDVKGQTNNRLFGDPNQTDRKINLLFVGRFDRQKGFDLLMQAAQALAESRPDIHLHVAGAAVLDTQEDQQALPNVTFEGWVPSEEIDNWYASADALLLPSRWEGLPLVIPEAYRNGTPVICSTRNGMASLVEEGETGYAFDLSLETLLATLEGLSLDELRSMRSAARGLYTTRFTAGRLCLQLNRLYARMLGHPMPPQETDHEQQLAKVA